MLTEIDNIYVFCSDAFYGYVMDIEIHSFTCCAFVISFYPHLLRSVLGFMGTVSVEFIKKNLDCSDTFGTMEICSRQG